MKRNERHFLLGYVSVDSGQLILVDPCYLKDWRDGDLPPLFVPEIK